MTFLPCVINLHTPPTNRAAIHGEVQLWTRELLAPVDVLQSARMCIEPNTKDKIGVISDTSKLHGTREFSDAHEK